MPFCFAIGKECRISPLSVLAKEHRKALLYGPVENPHAWLGLKPAEGGNLAFSALLPGATQVELVDASMDPPASQLVAKQGDEGFFECIVKGERVFRYRLRVVWSEGETEEFSDPYAFGPTLTEEDLEPFNRGEDPLAYRKLGGQPRVMGAIPGFAFSVWAPGAEGVSLLGDFNGWNASRHRMRRIGRTGVWEIFVPGVASGKQYKFRVFANGSFQDKADPFASFCEGPPGNASITYDPGGRDWQDSSWMESRRQLQPATSAFSVYEAHVGSWRNKPDGSPLSYLELIEELPGYLKEMGFSHVEFLPLAEHPLGASWGYQVTGYFAPTSRFGEPRDFMALVDALHAEGIGVIMDWVPAHFPRDDFALSRFDGTPTYEYADPRLGEHQDWGTLVFDYARPEVRSFLMSSAVAWLDRYHVDGLRVDAVASMLYLDYSREEGGWLPNRHGGRENLEAISLLQRTNEEVHRLHPGTVMIAEESTAFPKVTGKVSEGGLGFDFKWNMGWMHDTLEFFGAAPSARSGMAEKLTFACNYQYSEQYVHAFSHDEVVHGKAPMIYKMGAGEGDVSAHAAYLRALYAYMWAWPGKKTLFMGSEFGQTTEWNFESPLDWELLRHADHAGLSRLVKELNGLYRDHAFLPAGDSAPEKFRWFECGERAPAVFSFFRFGDIPQDTLLATCNFSGERIEKHRLGVPFSGSWRVVLHTQDEDFGGGLKSIPVSASSENAPLEQWKDTLVLDLPAASAIFLMPVAE